MKLSDGVLECPMTGICKLDIDKIVRCWRKTTFLSRWHDEYRLVNHRASVKVSISQADAQALIERLELVEIPSGIFKNGSTYRKKGMAAIAAKLQTEVAKAAIEYWASIGANR